MPKCCNNIFFEGVTSELCTSAPAVLLVYLSDNEDDFEATESAKMNLVGTWAPSHWWTEKHISVVKQMSSSERCSSHDIDVVKSRRRK